MDEIRPHHWITSVGRMSRRKPPKQCQPAAYYDQQAIDTLRAEVAYWKGQHLIQSREATKAEAETDALREVLRSALKLLHVDSDNIDQTIDEMLSATKDRL